MPRNPRPRAGYGRPLRRVGVGASAVVNAWQAPKPAVPTNPFTAASTSTSAPRPATTSPFITGARPPATPLPQLFTANARNDRPTAAAPGAFTTASNVDVRNASSPVSSMQLFGGVSNAPRFTLPSARPTTPAATRPVTPTPARPPTPVPYRPIPLPASRPPAAAAPRASTSSPREATTSSPREATTSSPREATTSSPREATTYDTMTTDRYTGGAIDPRLADESYRPGAQVQFTPAQADAFRAQAAAAKASSQTSSADTGRMAMYDTAGTSAPRPGLQSSPVQYTRPQPAGTQASAGQYTRPQPAGLQPSAGQYTNTQPPVPAAPAAPLPVGWAASQEAGLVDAINAAGAAIAAGNQRPAYQEYQGPGLNTSGGAYGGTWNQTDYNNSVNQLGSYLNQAALKGGSYLPPGYQGGYLPMGQGQDVGSGQEGPMGGPGWSIPGEQAPEDEWQYDLQGGWLPPGQAAPRDRTQVSMGGGFNPRQRDRGFNMMVSPPGIAAPRGAPNWTPALQQWDPPGLQAPAEHLNLSLLPGQGASPIGLDTHVRGGASW